MPFTDRQEAAEELVEQLKAYKGKKPLVLGIPRGSVPMAKTLADALDGDLDVVLVHKIGAPGNPEFAIGSVSEFGTVFQSDAVRYYGIPSQYIDQSAKEEIEKLKRRRQSYSPVRPPIDPTGRVVIIVDDGIATGSTMLAAIRALRQQKVEKIVVASPVAPPSVMELLGKEADEVVVLENPEDFFSISQFYEEFPQVEDEEVLKALTSRPDGEHRAA